MWLVEFIHTIHGLKYERQALINSVVPSEINDNHYKHFRQVAKDKAYQQISKIFKDVNIIYCESMEFINDCYIL